MKSHLIQFSVDFDEDSIRAQIEKNAATQVEKALFGNNYGGYSYGRSASMSKEMYTAVENTVDRFLERNRDAIIAEAGKQLAEKLARTKAAKALVEGLGKEGA